MKTIHTDGITHIVPVPDGTAEWYYGLSYEHGDLYEAEAIFRSGGTVRGNALCLIQYPDGAVYRPVPRQPGAYFGSPVFLDGCIYLLHVDFVRAAILIHCFDCETHQTAVFHELTLDDVKNCYNLQLHTAPLCLTRQGNDDRFEIIWPERTGFSMHPHESFFLRSGETLFFSRWHEEGEGPDYRYWETTVARDLRGNQIEVLPGDLRVMPNGALWHIV